MIKAFLTTLAILLVCSLENISHYFGFCFHGWMANIIGSFSAIAMGLAVYSMDIKIWLKSRNYGLRKSHKCKDHHHVIPVDLKPYVATRKFDGKQSWIEISRPNKKKIELLDDLLVFYSKHKSEPTKMALSCPFTKKWQIAKNCYALCGSFEEFELHAARPGPECPCLKFGTKVAFEKLTKVLTDNRYLNGDLKEEVGA